MAIFIVHNTDRRHIQALAACKRLGNEALMELFHKVLEDTKSSLISADDQTRIYRLQGRAELAADFLAAIEKADEILQKS